MLTIASEILEQLQLEKLVYFTWIKPQLNTCSKLANTNAGLMCELHSDITPFTQDVINVPKTFKKQPGSVSVALSYYGATRITRININTTCFRKLLKISRKNNNYPRWRWIFPFWKLFSFFTHVFIDKKNNKACY